MRERGSVTVVVLGVVAVTAAASLVLAAVGSAAAAQGRLDAVADLTALAGALDGRAAAARVAARNGAAVVSWRASGARVQVEVAAAGRRAVAAAELSGGDAPAPSSGP